jgi:hypothetical protein
MGHGSPLKYFDLQIGVAPSEEVVEFGSAESDRPLIRQSAETFDYARLIPMIDRNSGMTYSDDFIRRTDTLSEDVRM